MEYQRTKSQAIRSEVIVRVSGNVRHLAQRYRATLPRDVTTLDADDLESAGMFGVFQAIESFDPARGFKFFTFATRRIHGAMVDHVRELDFVPRLERQRAKAGKVTPAHMTLTLNKPLRGDVGMDARTVSEHGHLLADPKERTAESDELDAFGRMLCGMSRQERLLLTLYYREDLRMHEIGATLGLSESRVSQMHKQLIQRLRATTPRPEGRRRESFQGQGLHGEGETQDGKGCLCGVGGNDASDG